MRGRIAALLMLGTLGLPAGALAEGWSFHGREGGGASDAVACLPSEGGGQVFTSLCVSVGCLIGEAPTFGFSLQEVALPAEARIKVEVDGRAVADLVIPVRAGGAGGQVPLGGQETLLEALRTGSVATFSIGTSDGRRTYELPLTGSLAAIDRALPACLSLGAEPSPAGPAAPGSADPAQDAIAHNESFCADGAAEVGPEFRRDVDLDGDGRDDLILDYLGLLCDGSRGFCGTGGCSQEVWLGQPDGTYRLLVDDQFVSIDPAGPGLLRMVRDGGWCGLSGAESCEGTYAITNGRLEPVQ